MLLFSNVLSISHIYAEQNYTPKELNISIYADGVVEVEYKLEVDLTLARVNITLFGRTFENFLVKDQDGTLLDYKFYNGFTTVDVLGSQLIDISYSTSDLTNKTGPIWSLNLDALIVINILLPDGATIISLNPTPLAISIVGKTVSLTMPAGEVEITYILGVVGTKEHARALINDAEATIEEIKTEGIKVEEAETLLGQAADAYNEAQYVQAEQYASQAKTRAIETRFAAQEARVALDAAESAIDSAQDARRTSLLGQARQELEDAHHAYDLGDYERAKNLADQSAITAQLSKPSALFETSHILALLGTVIVASLIMIFRLARKRSELYKIKKELEEEKIKIDLDSLFERHPLLRLDEKEVIRYISESGGGVFTSELRQRFDMPKSSAWRMIRRLEKEEIIETKTVGRETFVQISSRYRVQNRREE